MSTRAFGARIERNVDPKLLRGEGAFVDDIPLPDALHVAFLRSHHARATFEKVDISAAARHPGVVAIYTSDNIGALDVILGADHLARLDAASPIDLGFPHDFLRLDFIRGGLTGGTSVRPRG